MLADAFMFSGDKSASANTDVTKRDLQCPSPRVFADPDEEAEDCIGMVVGFHPSEMLSVVDVTGYTHSMPLRKVAEDLGRRPPKTIRCRSVNPAASHH